MEEENIKSKKKPIVAIVLIIFLAIISYWAISYNKGASESPEPSFQELSDTDFSNVDPNMPDEVLESIKNNYNNAQEVLNNDQYNLEANMRKANTLYQVKEYDKAIIIYQKMGELNPNNSASFKALGDVYYAQMNYEQAESMYLTAIKNAPGAPEAYSQLAEIYRYHLNGDEEKIKKFFEDGIGKLGINRYSLIQTYASYLEDIGDLENAIAQWKAVSMDFPDNQEIRDRIVELEEKTNNK